MILALLHIDPEAYRDRLRPLFVGASPTLMLGLP